MVQTIPTYDPDALPAILLTRPEQQARRFADALTAAWRADLWIEVSPLLEIVPVKARWPRAVASVIFTSENAVRFQPLAGPRGVPAYCVGPRTTAAARTLGFDAVDCGGGAEDVYARIFQDQPRQPLVHMRGKHARGDLAARLRHAGITVDDVVCYDQARRDLTAAAERMIRSGPVIAPVFSPRTAEGLQAAVADLGAPTVRAICLSQAIAECLEPESFYSVDVTQKPNGDSMVAAILSALQLES